MPGQRKYGQDHDHYEWSPITSRPPVHWPDNARVALCIILEMEHWDWDLPADAPTAVTPLGGRPGGFGGGGGRFPDIAGYSQHEYGNRVGVFRLLKILDKYGIQPTIAMDKATADNYPFLVRECKQRGLEVIGHGLSARRIIHAGMSEDEERQYIRDSINALKSAFGTAPRGWMGPDFQESVRTPDLLAAEGIQYVCDWSNDEQPYRMTVKQGELYSLGVDHDLDDVSIHVNGGRLISEYRQIFIDQFDGLYHDGATSGRVLVANIRPWVMGQPWRSKYLNDVLAHIDSYAGVWKASGGEIIDWCKQHAVIGASAVPA